MPRNPEPVIATANFTTLTAQVTFDRPLQPGPLNTANWGFTCAGTRKVATSAASIGNNVNFTLGIGGSTDPNPDHVDYDPPPFDVIDTEGNPADAFYNFDLTCDTPPVDNLLSVTS